MMIKILCFASLREVLDFPPMLEQPSVPGETVGSIWTRISSGKSVQGSVLCALNATYTDFSTEVRDGDEVAFFPPVTGG